MKDTVQITILGQKHTIRSEAGPEEVRRVAEFVNEQVETVIAGKKAVDTMNAAVLALLNVGGAYLRLKQRHEEEGEASDRLKHLLERLQEVCPDLDPVDS